MQQNQPPLHALSLGSLLSLMDEVTAAAFRGPLWVRCEIVAAYSKGQGGNAWWSFQVRDPDGSKANTTVFVWSQHVGRVVHRFKNETGMDLAAGMQVLMLVQPSFSAEWGFRLVGLSIDSSYTVGAVQKERDRIRETLRNEGVWDANRKLPAPFDFTRVLIVAPEGSAGLGDVMREAQLLVDADVCAFDVIHAPFEGNRAVSVLSAVLARPMDPNVYDAVCLVRGGGAVTGLATLDHEQLVRAVCLCPVPVIVGLGHERDSTLLDEVAHTSRGTPSKAIGHIVGTIVRNAQSAEEHWQGFRQDVLARVEEAQARADEKCSEMAVRTDSLLNRAAETVDGMVREAIGLGPQATLQRGYALVRGTQGPVASVADARDAKRLILTFHDGEIAVLPELSEHS